MIFVINYLLMITSINCLVGQMWGKKERKNAQHNLPEPKVMYFKLSFTIINDKDKQQVLTFHLKS